DPDQRPHDQQILVAARVPAGDRRHAPQRDPGGDQVLAGAPIAEPAGERRGQRVDDDEHEPERPRAGVGEPELDAHALEHRREHVAIDVIQEVDRGQDDQDRQREAADVVRGADPAHKRMLPSRSTVRPSIALALILCLAGCRPSASTATPTEHESIDEASGAAARWSYQIGVDERLERMQLSLCMEGQLPRRLTAGREAIHFVTDARVRGGPELQRDGRTLAITTLGEHGCVDIEIDLARASASGRDSSRRGDTLMLAPDRWLWYPAQIPERLEARARFELPEAVAATVPWPHVDADDRSGWRQLD